MVEIKEWDRGETVRIQNTYIDSDDELYDPDTIELKIYEPNGSLKTTVTFAAGEIVKSSTGVYYYDHTIADDATVGWWISKWTAVIGTQTDRESDQFYVRDPEEKLYCTVEQVWERSGQDDTFVNRSTTLMYIKESMDNIDSMMGKSFQYGTSVTEWFDTSQPDENIKRTSVFLRYTPIISMVSVEEYDTDNNLSETHDSDDYWIDLKTGYLRLASGEFGQQKHRVKVTYTYGYETVPRKISQLCAVLSAMKVHLHYIGQSVDDVTSWSAGGLCFTGDTKLLTVDGYKTFESLAGNNADIMNKDGIVSNGKVWCTGEKDIVKLTLNNNEEIKCTPNHLFMVDEGYGVQANDLLGRKLKLYNSNEDIKVIAVIPHGSELVYDFTEPLTHWGIINNGVIVHNSVGVGEPYTASARAVELLSRERDKLIANIGRLRQSIFIV